MQDKPWKKEKTYTSVLLTITVAAIIVCAAAFTLKRDAPVMTQGSPEQGNTSYYSLNSLSSQENEGKAAVSREEAASKSSSVPPEKKERYLITVHDGKIGVFREGETSPFLIADTEVYLLPEEDIKILRKGIRVDSFSAVKGVLEDYE